MQPKRSYSSDPGRHLSRGTSHRGFLPLVVLVVFLLYLSTLSPHLGHHLTDALPGVESCTVLTVTDGSYAGLLDDGPALAPSLEPCLRFPCTAVLDLLSQDYLVPQPRSPPVPFSA